MPQNLDRRPRLLDLIDNTTKLLPRLKEVSFSEARQKLSSIVDQVEKSGPPVKILRHGKVVAVVVNAEEYKLKSVRSKPFKLAGSIKLRKGVDFDKFIAEGRKQFAVALDARRERLLEEINEP